MLSSSDRVTIGIFASVAEDLGRCPPHSAFGRVIRVRAPPLANTGAAAFHRGRSGAAKPNLRVPQQVDAANTVDPRQ